MTVAVRRTVPVLLLVLAVTAGCAWIRNVTYPPSFNYVPEENL